MRILLLAPLLLAACNPQQLATFQSDAAKVQAVANSVVVAGQLFCAKAAPSGPIVVALANSFGVPVTVTGQASADVSAACNVIGGIPVSPPFNPVSAPTVAAPVTTLPAAQ